MSAHTEAKARKLLASGGVTRVEGSIWQARASGKNGMYVIDLNGPHCDCLGFRYNRKCSHLRAVMLAIEAEESDQGAD